MKTCCLRSELLKEKMKGMLGLGAQQPAPLPLAWSAPLIELAQWWQGLLLPTCPSLLPSPPVWFPQFKNHHFLESVYINTLVGMDIKASA